MLFTRYSSYLKIIAFSSVYTVWNEDISYSQNSNNAYRKVEKLNKIFFLIISYNSFKQNLQKYWQASLRLS